MHPIPESSGSETLVVCVTTVSSTAMSETSFIVGDPSDVGPLPDGHEDPSTIVDLRLRLKHLLGNESFSDAVFIIERDGKDTVTICVHKPLLCAGSRYFAAMFSKTWLTSDPIRLEEGDANSMWSILRWIYCQELVFVAGGLPDVLKAANYYEVVSLISFIGSSFEKVDHKFVWTFYSIALQMYMNVIAEKSLAIIYSNPQLNLDLEDFLSASAEAITAVLDQQKLSGEYDLQLFRRLVEWAAAECERKGLEITAANRRLMLDPFIFKLSFDGMTATEFAGPPCESGILTEGEQALVLRMKAGKDVVTPFRKTQADSKPRKEGSVIRLDCVTYKPGKYYRFNQCNGCDRVICVDCLEEVDRVIDCCDEGTNYDDCGEGEIYDEDVELEAEHCTGPY